MVLGRKVILKSRETGDVYSFVSMKEADRFLRRGSCYTSNAIKRRKTVYNFSGEEFDVSVDGKTKHVKNNPQKYSNKMNQCCITCARSYGFCSWSRRFEPVEGWEATPSYDKEGNPYSYTVTSCPQYIMDAPTPEERKRQIEILKEEKKRNG